MGMNITPLTRPEIPLTTSNLVVDSNLSMGSYDVITNNLGVGGDVAIDGSILRIINCKPSTTKYLDITSFNQTAGGWNSSYLVVLPFIPSTYYSGGLTIWYEQTPHNARITIYNVDGSKTSINATPTKTDITLPNGTIGVVAFVQSRDEEYGYMYVGWENDYLPLPTPPETP